MLTLKLQYFGHLMRRTDSSEKTLILGKMKAGGEGDDKGWDGWMASPTRWTWVWVNSGSWWWTREAWHAAVHGVAKSRTWLNDWTELTYLGFPDGSMGKESACNAGDTGDMGLITGSERFPWRRRWQPTWVFLPGEFHGQRSLAGYSPKGHKELEMTEH